VCPRTDGSHDRGSSRREQCTVGQRPNATRGPRGRRRRSGRRTTRLLKPWSRRAPRRQPVTRGGKVSLRGQLIQRHVIAREIFMSKG
jgi:hypothetical protein